MYSVYQLQFCDYPKLGEIFIARDFHDNPALHDNHILHISFSYIVVVPVLFDEKFMTEDKIPKGLMHHSPNRTNLTQKD